MDNWRSVSAEALMSTKTGSIGHKVSVALIVSPGTRVRGHNHPPLPRIVHYVCIPRMKIPCIARLLTAPPILTSKRVRFICKI